MSSNNTPAISTILPEAIIGAVVLWTLFQAAYRTTQELQDEVTKKDGLIRALQEKLSEYEVSPIEIVFDPDTTKVSSYYVDHPYVMGSLYRLGVINSGRKSAENVTVLITSFPPGGSRYLPYPLRYMGDSTDSFRESANGKRIDPGDEPAYFVDFVEKLYRNIPTQPQNDYVNNLILCHTRQDVANFIPNGVYDISVVARAKDHSETSAKTFRVKATTNTLTVEPLSAQDLAAMQVGTPYTQSSPVTVDPGPGPAFPRQVGQSANARIYGWVVVGTEREDPNAQFTDQQIETYTTWLRTLEPRAKAHVATGSFIRMSLTDDRAGTPLWDGQVHAGPVVSVLTALEVVQLGTGSDRALSFEVLISSWVMVLNALPALVSNLGSGRVRLRFGLYPYGPNGERVIDVDFGAAPRPVRRADPDQIAPWYKYTSLFNASSLPHDILAAPLKDLLDRFSYGRLDALQEWVAQRVTCALPST
jgi:hypothetical protein